ncbi:unnamed protein product [Paramecium pentaurelia]|uniref:Uncharacterized protein n=1 Tax=Paramecium pentaurelia TaxID=43138 RepID=A0A8S1SAP4_9CILI|nr:unnamed protein product [Paramecium pentaurelia]
METDRLRKSIKNQFEQKEIKQKGEFLSIIDQELQSLKEKLATQILQENNNIIKYNIKLLQLEKKNAEKQDIMIDQELQLRNYATLKQQSLQFDVSTQYNEIQQIDKDDQKNEINILNVNVQIEELKTRNLKLSLKLFKLLLYFVDLELYDSEFAKQAALDDFPCDQLYKPKLPEIQNMILNLEVNEKKYQSIIKQKKMKKQLYVYDFSSDAKTDQQKRSIFTLGEQLDDQKYLEQLLQPKRNTQPKCKTLNDIILKKRRQSIDTSEPRLDFYKINRKLIADRFQQQPIQFLSYQQCRIHSLSIKH